MITAVIGAQYGSEGKGVVVSQMSKLFHWQGYVRVGAPNAGHSHIAYGKKWAQRMLPIGWAAGDSAALILGRGAVIDKEQLRKEIHAAQEFDPNVSTRVFVDPYATVLTDDHREIEGRTKGALWGRIGSTGEGVGEARMNRMRRNRDNPSLVGSISVDWRTTDTVEFLSQLSQDNVLIEGTQGSGLSLTHGPWPYVTTADVNVSGILADCGIPATRIDLNAVLVARTYPIRVAGNSGPLRDELSWEELSMRVGRELREQTTVTKLVRRVGAWDDDLFNRALILNQPDFAVITFMDYIEPDVEGMTDWEAVMAFPRARNFIDHITANHNVDIIAVGTGGPDWAMAWRREMMEEFGNVK